MIRTIALLFFSLVVAYAQPALPEGPGKKLLEGTCGACHDVGTATGARHSRTAWESIVDSMVARGAQGSDEDFAAIAGYLARYFGVVNVNKAPAKEIADVLEIPVAAAEAIVRQRTEAGPFQDVDGLKKISGVDAAVLQSRRDRIAFQ